MFKVEDGYVLRPKNITEEIYNTFLKEYVGHGKYAFQYIGFDQHSETDSNLGLFVRKHKTDAYNLLKFFKNYIDMSVYTMVENIEEARRNELTKRYSMFFDNTKQIKFLSKLKKQALKNEERNRKNPNNPYNYKMKFSYVPANASRIELDGVGYWRHFDALSEEKEINEILCKYFKAEVIPPVGIESVYSNAGSKKLKLFLNGVGYTFFNQKENTTADYLNDSCWGFLKEGVVPLDVKLSIIEQEIKSVKKKYAYDLYFYEAQKFANEGLVQLKQEVEAFCAKERDEAIIQRLNKKLEEIETLINNYNDDEDAIKEAKNTYLVRKELSNLSR